MEVTFHGRASHAGMYPEEGRNAIAACGARDRRPAPRRVDDISTANVGEIHGGVAANIVAEHCTFVAEARSHDERRLADLVQEMLESISFAAEMSECRARRRSAQVVPRLPLQARTTRWFASRPTHSVESGQDISFGLSGGAADANIFNERGLQCLNLANGMMDIHTPDERIAVADLEAMVDVTLALVDAALA
jgi:tripeptide aminopeptidase